MRVINRTQIRSDIEPVLDPSKGSGKGSASVSEHDAQIRQPLQNAAKDERADRTGHFGRHPNEPREPVLLHVLLAHHVPRMNEDGHAQSFARFEKIEESRLVKIELVDVSAD